MSSLFVMNMLTFMSSMMPVFGFLISRITFPIDRKIWIVPIEAALLGLAAYLMLGFSWEAPGRVDPMLYSLTLSLYPLLMAIMLPILSWRFGVARGLALTLMLGFLVTELQEIVGFGKMYLGQWDNVLALQSYWAWFTPLNHAYSVAVAGLALYVARVSRYWILFVVVPSFVIGVVCELLIYPLLGYGFYSVWDFARRLLWLPILLLWVNPGREMS